MDPILLERLVAALERMAPPAAIPVDLAAADAFVWHPHPSQLAPVAKVAHVDLSLLVGVDRQKKLIMANTLQFARGKPANNAMLWGARGMGKSSLVKAAHAEANRQMAGSLALIEIAREDIGTLPDLLRILRAESRRCLVFCDDLSFEKEDADYKALKSVLDGGIEGRPETVLFYATSNRRHLMPRDMIENERASAINPSEATEEKVSLSDRFGLWVGFHNADKEAYFAMVEGYARELGLAIDGETLRAKAAAWTVVRGARSGRVAWQFVQDLAGQIG